MKRVFVLALLATTASLTGCGETPEGPSTNGSDEDQVRSVATDFYDATRSDDWGKACDLLSPKARVGIAQAAALLGTDPKDCAETLEAAYQAGDGPGTLRITSVRISDERAVAPGAQIQDGKASNLNFERFDGKWYLGQDD